MKKKQNDFGLTRESVEPFISTKSSHQGIHSSLYVILIDKIGKNTQLSLNVGKTMIVNPRDINSSYHFKWRSIWPSTILRTLYCLIYHIRCKFTTQVCDCSRHPDMFYYFRNKIANTIDDVVLTVYLPLLLGWAYSRTSYYSIW